MFKARKINSKILNRKICFWKICYYSSLGEISHPDDDDSKFLWNVDQYLPHSKAQYLRRQLSPFSSCLFQGLSKLSTFFILISEVPISAVRYFSYFLCVGGETLLASRSFACITTASFSNTDKHCVRGKWTLETCLSSAIQHWRHCDVIDHNNGSWIT